MLSKTDRSKYIMTSFILFMDL